MGVITDFLAASKTIDSTAPSSPGSKVAARELKAIKAKGDPTLPTAFAAADQIQSIAVYSGTVSGGTFALGLTLADGTYVKTAGIAYNANAATIEGAIDTAVTAAGTVTGWTNGDISVAVGTDLTAGDGTLTYDGTSVDDQAVGLATIDGALLTGGGSANTIVVTNPGHVPVSGWSAGDITVAGGDLTSAPVTLTFDGTSVDELNHALVVVDGTLLTGGGSAGAVTKTTAGGPARNGYGLLSVLGILRGTFPAYGDTPTTSLLQWADRDQAVISPVTIDLICKDIAILEGTNTGADGDAIYAALVTQTDINVG